MTQQPPSLLKYLLCLAALFGTFVLLIYANHIYIKGKLFIYPRDGLPEQEFYPELDPMLEREWIQTLQRGKIVYVESWDPYGLSKKFRVHFDDGKVASGKLMRPFSFWERSFHDFVYAKADRNHQRYSRSAAGEYQAMSELGAFYVDRALGWYKKPPTAGRKISSKMFYAEDDSWFGFWQRAIIPDHEVEVVLIAWFANITVKPPNNHMLELITHKREDTPSHKELKAASQISTVMVFDFLIDDHDRIEKHNWLQDATGQYIHWDSGLGFRHGAYGRRERDKEIFCGHRDWVTITTERSEDHKTCEKMCYFSNATVSQLRQYDYQLKVSKESFVRLSSLVVEKMRGDPLYPVFHFNAYLPGRGRFPKVNYRAEDFLEGIDIRVHELTKYIQNCIDLYGEEAVIKEDF